MPIKLPLPPSSITGDLGPYLMATWRVVDALPTFSLFSGSSPLSLVTGVGGNVAVNVDGNSANSRLWVKYPSSGEPNTGSWVTVA